MVAFSTLSVLLSAVSLVVAVNPGSYLITNVQFPGQTVVGTDVAREGMPISTFNVSFVEFATNWLKRIERIELLFLT